MKLQVSFCYNTREKFCTAVASTNTIEAVFIFRVYPNPFILYGIPFEHLTSPLSAGEKVCVSFFLNVFPTHRAQRSALHAPLTRTDQQVAAALPADKPVTLQATHCSFGQDHFFLTLFLAYMEAKPSRMRLLLARKARTPHALFIHTGQIGQPFIVYGPKFTERTPPKSYHPSQFNLPIDMLPLHGAFCRFS